MDAPSNPDSVDPGTRAAEQHESGVAHRADREPTPDEERVAERQQVDPAVGEHFQEMAEIGAELKGEGEIVPEKGA